MQNAERFQNANNHKKSQKSLSRARSAKEQVDSSAAYNERKNRDEARASEKRNIATKTKVVDLHPLPNHSHPMVLWK